MTQAEFLAWIEFHRLNPFDDYARLYRPAALVATSMSGQDVNELLNWLQPEKPPPGMSEADFRTLKALGIRKP